MRAKLPVYFDPGQDLVFFWCENEAKVIRRRCDSTSGNLNKTSVRRKVQRCLSGNGLNFSELFDDIYYVKCEKIMRGCG